MNEVTTLEELDSLDSDLMVAGYLAGLGRKQVNYMQKDKAYWHGYLNGQVDSKQMPISEAQCKIARFVVERGDMRVIFGGGRAN